MPRRALAVSEGRTRAEDADVTTGFASRTSVSAVTHRQATHGREEADARCIGEQWKGSSDRTVGFGRGTLKRGRISRTGRQSGIGSQRDNRWLSVK